ncbi:MAG: hypothetical protein ACTHMV_16395 [Chitinophagaceae bacterium]
MKYTGCKSILINNGNETEWVMSELRWPYAWAMNVHEAASLIIQSENHETAYDECWVYR